MKRAWIVLEQRGDQMIALAGTEDPKAINAALAALKQYKDRKIQLDGVDLTDIRSTVVEELQTQNIQDVLDSEEDKVSNILDMVDIDT